jgi:hypothetical protein
MFLSDNKPEIIFKDLSQTLAKLSKILDQLEEILTTGKFSLPEPQIIKTYNYVSTGNLEEMLNVMSDVMLDMMSEEKWEIVGENGIIKLHRDLPDGPARILTDMNTGMVFLKEYYVHGESVARY